MTQPKPPFDPDVKALLENGKIIQPVADVVRARTLARARATVAAAITPPPEAVHAWWKRVLPVAIAASVALVVGAAGAVAALRSRAPQPPPPAPPMQPTVSAPASVPSAVPSPAPPTMPPPVESTVKAQPRAARPISPQESYAAELALLQRAQAAYGGRDFSVALALVGEHARRFPNGRLAEEREALRVRSLAGSGRSDEAVRAAASFANRFPRSVLLPRLNRELRNQN